MTGMPAVVAIIAVLVMTLVPVATRRRRERSRAGARLRVHLARDRAGAVPPGSGPGSLRERWRVAARTVDGRVGAAGRWCRLRVRRPADPVADQRVGWAILAAAITFAAAGPVAAGLVAVAVVCVPAAMARRDRRRRSAAVIAQVPDLIDLLHLGVDAGLGAGTALATVIEHLDGDDDLAGALRRIRQRVGRGDRLVDALAELEAPSEPVRALREALVAAQRHGAPLAPALDRAAADARDLRRRHREEAARTLPVKLLFPLVFCTLPALGLLTVVPLLARSLLSLTP